MIDPLDHALRFLLGFIILAAIGVALRQPLIIATAALLIGAAWIVGTLTVELYRRVE